MTIYDFQEAKYNSLSIRCIVLLLIVIFLYIWLFQLKNAADIAAPCDISQAIAVLHDPQRPLTSSVIELLRGCLVLLYFRTPRTGSTSVVYLLDELSTVLGFTSILDIPPSVIRDDHDSWVC